MFFPQFPFILSPLWGSIGHTNRNSLLIVSENMELYKPLTIENHRPSNPGKGPHALPQRARLFAVAPSKAPSTGPGEGDFRGRSCQQAHPFLLHDQCGQDRGHAGATRGGRAEQDAVTGKPMSVSCLMSRFMIQASSCLPDVFMPWNGARARGSVSHISTTFF